MIPHSSFWPIAVAELRTVTRLTRTWILLAASIALIAYLFASEAMDHANYSIVSASAGTTSPRFILGGAANLDRALSEYLLLLFQIGILALICDIRARDIRERIVGVLDAKPITNTVLLAARLTANVVVLTIAMATVFALIAVTNITLSYLETPYGTSSMEPISILSFLVMDLIPNLAVWGAFAVLLATLIRFRLLVLLLGIGLAAALFTFTPLLPNYLQETVSSVTTTVILPSDLAPEFTNGVIVLQRLTLLLLAAGLLLASSVFYPREDRSSKLFGIAGGLGCLVLGSGILVGSFQNAFERRLESEALVAAHKALRDEPRADVLHIDGAIEIDPGGQLDVRYTIALNTPEETHDSLIFAFNPGLEISSLTLDGKAVEYRFEKGLITIRREGSNKNEASELQLSAEGNLDMSFGYLDSRLDERWETAADGNAMRRLGYQIGVNNNEYVALTPALKWYPTAGAAYGEDFVNEILRDHFTVDLQVDVPSTWIVAGPGARQTLTSSDSARYRFAPKASVPAIALLASNFDRRSINAAGVEFELLISPKHTRNFDLFADAMPVLEERLNEIFQKAQASRLAYPYELFSAVEVPRSLRVYGGGSRMDSIHGLPGILLIRETGFPSAAFEYYVRNQRQMRDGKVPAGSLYTLLKYYFVNDFDGGNPFIAAARNFVNFQTSATGAGAPAVNYFINELVLKILTDVKGFYSIYYAGGPFRYQQAIVRMLDRTNVPRIVGSYVSALRNYLINRPQVWDEMLSTPLADLDFESNPRRTLDAFVLKTGAVADALHDFVDEADLSRFLSKLREHHAGRTYRYADFQKIASESGVDLDSLVGDWVDETTLPGFQLHEPHTIRILDDDQGNPVYQTTFYVSNEEAAPGIVQIKFEKDTDTVWRHGTTRPILINSNSYSKIALHSMYPLSWVTLRPYLSLNREAVEIKLEKPRSLDPQNVEALPLITSVDWRPPDDGTIVVDDLDEGFSIAGNLLTKALNRWTTGKKRSFGGVFIDQGLDEGLPRLNAPGQYISSWYRTSNPVSYGKYRHTSAVTRRGGTGDSYVQFNARLPTGGNWSLDYYFPFRGMESNRVRHLEEPVNASVLFRGYISMRATGTYSMTVNNGGQSFAIQLDVSEADHGWNQLGNFELEEGVVSVQVQNFGRMEIYADAIRWRPIPSSN